MGRHWCLWDWRSIESRFQWDKRCRKRLREGGGDARKIESHVGLGKWYHMRVHNILMG